VTRATVIVLGAVAISILSRPALPTPEPKFRYNPDDYGRGEVIHDWPRRANWQVTLIAGGDGMHIDTCVFGTQNDIQSRTAFITFAYVPDSDIDVVYGDRDFAAAGPSPFGPGFGKIALGVDGRQFYNFYNTRVIETIYGELFVVAHFDIDIATMDIEKMGKYPPLIDAMTGGRMLIVSTTGPMTQAPLPTPAFAPAAGFPLTGFTQIMDDLRACWRAVYFD